MVVNPRRREACTTELTRDFWIWVGEQRGKEGKKEEEGIIVKVVAQGEKSLLVVTIQSS